MHNHGDDWQVAKPIGLQSMDGTSDTVIPAQKFAHPDLTAGGEPRAHVSLKKLETLWFNTGTLCNIACVN